MLLTIYDREQGHINKNKTSQNNNSKTEESRRKEFYFFTISQLGDPLDTMEVGGVKQEEEVRDTLLVSSQQPASFFEQHQHLPEENDFTYCEEQLQSFQFLSAKHTKQNKKVDVDNDNKARRADSVASLAEKFIQSLGCVLKNS